MVSPGETAAAAVVESGNRSYGRFPTWAAALGISGRSLAVLAAIAHHADGEGKAYPAMSTIATLAGIKRPNVPPAVAQLIAAGVLQKEIRTDERGHRSNLYTIIYKPVVLPHKRTPVTRGGNRVLPLGGTGGVPQGGNRTEQFGTEHGRHSLPVRARDGFSLDAYQPDATMLAWAAEHVPELNDPLRAKTIESFKDHYRNKGFVPDLDAAFRKWLIHEPYFRRRELRGRRGPQQKKSTAQIAMAAALDQVRGSK
jgi:hypothetical protein